MESTISRGARHHPSRRAPPAPAGRAPLASPAPPRPGHGLADSPLTQPLEVDDTRSPLGCRSSGVRRRAPISSRSAGRPSAGRWRTESGPGWWSPAAVQTPGMPVVGAALRPGVQDQSARARTPRRTRWRSPRHSSRSRRHRPRRVLGRWGRIRGGAADHRDRTVSVRNQRDGGGAHRWARRRTRCWRGPAAADGAAGRPRQRPQSAACRADVEPSTPTTIVARVGPFIAGLLRQPCGRPSHRGLPPRARSRRAGRRRSRARR